MIVNFFLKHKLHPKDIESISNLFLTLISLYTCYMIYFTEEYYTTICVLYGYMVIDLFFTPFHKWDMFIHHFFTISSVQFVLENINVNANYYSTRQLLITEASSIFLGMKYFVNKSNYNILKIIVNLLFVITLLIFLIIALVTPLASIPGWSKKFLSSADKKEKITLSGIDS